MKAILEPIKRAIIWCVGHLMPNDIIVRITPDQVPDTPQMFMVPIEKIDGRLYHGQAMLTVDPRQPRATRRANLRDFNKLRKKLDR